jgi:hypothetical protein
VIGVYGIRLWRQEDTSAIVLAEPDDLQLNNGSVNWTSSPLPFVGAIPAVTLHILLVDPLGRTGTVTAIVAAAS